ncbi:hypothetical protein BDD43_1911 [Mucilaginibacter gracilis]|uniref:Uncharacterized protein n=1 Tax=Mucilaginibacter gracilis TaxID=423350 RepID=A0A495IYG6_9SPHI|nr:hypothetical protein [Mucilaginibacter gracilis]RKR81755.1 hypothetical protein BDD43_1911 [Mucilaginibacter gracilis]
MKQQLPEYLLCEDPTAEGGNLFIYHVLTRSLVHVIHTDAMPADETKYNNRKHFDYTFKNNLGREEKIMFVAEVVDSGTGIAQSVLEQCAHWYACYLGWEEECDDVTTTTI